MKKYGVVASTNDVTYHSYKSIPTKSDSINTPRGGWLEFEIHYTNSGKSDMVSYEIKTLDGKIIRQCKGKDLGNKKISGTGTVTQYNPAQYGGSGFHNVYTLVDGLYWDSLHIDTPINGPFEVFVTDKEANRKYYKRYKIIPDVKK